MGDIHAHTYMQTLKTVGKVGKDHKTRKSGENSNKIVKSACNFFFMKKHFEFLKIITLRENKKKKKLSANFAFPATNEIAWKKCILQVHSPHAALHAVYTDRPKYTLYY